MSLLKRFKNLWHLSEFEIPELGQKMSDLPTGSIIVNSLFNKKEMAQIIKLDDDITKIIHD